MNKKLIYLDDSELSLKRLQYVLSKKGYTVYTTTNWTEAHNLIQQKNLRLMLCDVRLSGVRGENICLTLKNTTPHVKVILYSSLDDKELALIAEENQADGWCSKMSTFKELVRKIEMVGFWEGKKKPEEKKVFRILYLDQDSKVRAEVREVFGERGHHVDTEFTWADAKPRIFEWDLLICDMMNHSPNGEQICRILRKTVPELQIVLYSKMPREELEDVADAVDIDRYFCQKYTSVMKLLTEVENMIPHS